MLQVQSKRHPFIEVNSCRQIAIPYRIETLSTEHFLYLLNKYNGIKRKIYHSILEPTMDGSFEHALITWVPFDLDNKDCLLNMRKLFEYCTRYNYKCTFTFSTRGFWFFIKTTAVPLMNPKQALGNAQRHIAQEVGFTIGKSDICDLDTTCVGDVARVTRCLGTRDLDRNRFCISLTQQELYLSYEEIIKLSETYRDTYYYSGEVLFDMTPFDTAPSPTFSNEIINQMKDIPLTNIDLDIANNVDDLIYLPCVNGWLKYPARGVYQARYYYAVFCAEELVSKEQCDYFAKLYFGKAPRTDRHGTNYIHWIKDKTMQKAYSGDKIFPSCDTLLLKGLCPGKCEHYKGKNSPLYFNG